MTDEVDEIKQLLEEFEYTCHTKAWVTLPQDWKQPGSQIRLNGPEVSMTREGKPVPIVVVELEKLTKLLELAKLGVADKGDGDNKFWDSEKTDQVASAGVSL